MKRLQKRRYLCKKFEKIVSNFEKYSEKKKILVIDDLEVSRAVLNSMFKDKYEILEATNGIEGLGLLKKYNGDIAIILLDIMTPQMDGEEFLQEKNKLPKAENIPVVVISSENDVAVQLGMLKNGVADYIAKPFEKKLTQQRVENAMAYQSRFKQLVQEYQNLLKES